MAEYKAPLKDIRFVMNEVFEAEQLWSSLAGTKDTVDMDDEELITYQFQSSPFGQTKVVKYQFTNQELNVTNYEDQ